MTKDNSCLPDGGEEMGMTNEQYKGMLIDQLRSWKRNLELALASNNQSIIKLSREQIEDLEEKLKF